jgi:hypothetical protein
MSLRGHICDKCLIIDVVLTCLYKDGTIKESRAHSCKQDRVLEVQQKNKQKMIKLLGCLCTVFPKFLAGKVMMCAKSTAKYYLSFKKYDSLPSTLGHDRVRILDMVDQHE